MDPKQLTKLCINFIRAENQMQNAVEDGVNVHGAISEMNGAIDNLVMEAIKHHWKPISDAPMDNSEILATDGEKIFMAAYDVDGWFEISERYVVSPTHFFDFAGLLPEPIPNQVSFHEYPGIWSGCEATFKMKGMAVTVRTADCVKGMNIKCTIMVNDNDARDIKLYTTNRHRLIACMVKEHS